MQYWRNEKSFQTLSSCKAAEQQTEFTHCSGVFIFEFEQVLRLGVLKTLKTTILFLNFTRKQFFYLQFFHWKCLQPAPIPRYHSRLRVNTLWWWYIVFVVWWTDERRLALFPAGTSQWFSPSQICDMPQAGFEPAQNLSSDSVWWSSAVVTTTTSRRHNG